MEDDIIHTHTTLLFKNNDRTVTTDWQNVMKC